MEDRWQGSLELAGNRINQVTCMKYLGVEINDKENSLDHIKTRKQKALSGIFKLKSNGILNEHMHPSMRTQLYKKYVRPVLWYSFETCNMSQSNLITIKRHEAALNIDSTLERFAEIKADFLTRLAQNKFTKKLIDFMEYTDYQNDFISEIYDHLDILSFDIETSTLEACKIFKAKKREERRHYKENQNVTKLRKAFNIKNEAEMIRRVTNLNNFDVSP
ncbi:unnamed protein product [Brachionus calyciflorus]|uniref:Uncharacterized protein n=1 Tax=Brachionus calyciflorus TaxID=104777 RepID=A0A814LP73_9BILA|nr:unnamed protein product [Brachionus calyciflorus]